MNKHLTHKLTFEFAWWLVTAIVCLLVYLRNSAGLATYPFLIANMVFIITFITVTRHVFLLRHSFVANSRNLMVLLIFVCIPLFIYTLTMYREFKMFWDDGRLIPFLNPGEYETQMNVANFFRREMLFFSIGSMIATFIFPFTLVKAIWRKHNKGYV
ncbi:MAG TPA: hypothetical protein ENK85_00210 [Saprospiraceae bacterium]|nr:hypothetical protein [Saprospiraceae bacterium]